MEAELNKLRHERNSVQVDTCWEISNVNFKLI